MKQLLFVLPRFDRENWGAAENLVWNLARTLTASGLARCVIVSFQSGEEQPSEEVVSGVEIHRFKEAGKRWTLLGPVRPATEMVALMEYLKTHRFDLVHHFLIGRRALLLANQLRKWKTPFIMHCLNRDFQMAPAHQHFFDLPWVRRRGREQKRRLKQMVNQNRKALTMADFLFCNGRELQNALEKQLPDSQVQSFASGVDVEYFSRPSGAMFRSFFQIPEAQPILLSVGHIGEQNNQKFLLELLSVLNRRTRHCRLVLLGREASPRSDYLKSFWRMAKERGLSEYLTVIPGLPPGDDRFRAAYQAASLVLLPARESVTGSAILEAWAAGVPVIASPCGEAADLVEDGINGRLAGVYQFTDWVAGTEGFLSERLRNMHESMRSAGALRARELDWPRRVAELMKFYDIVIENHNKSRSQGGGNIEDKTR